MTLSNEIINFAAGNTTLYEAAESFYRYENERTSENEAKLTKAFFEEIERKSGVKREGIEINAWCNHPSVRWASFAVIDAVINTIIPIVVIPEFNIFADFRTVGYGDIVKFKVMPRGFYTVSRGN